MTCFDHSNISFSLPSLYNFKAIKFCLCIKFNLCTNLQLDLICILHLPQTNMEGGGEREREGESEWKRWCFVQFQILPSNTFSSYSISPNVGGLEFSLTANCTYKPLGWKKTKHTRRRENNYLSLMPQRSMRKSLKFPREPCWTKMRSLGWLSIKMSLMQPWKAVMGFKHFESVKLSGHPVGQRGEKRVRWRILKW